MRKLLLSIIALIPLSFAVKAQTSGGPDQYGYVWLNDQDPNGPVYNWIEIDGLPNTVEVTTLTDDNVTATINLPNPFRYYWYYVNSFHIGSNGYITFSGNTNIASTANGFPAIPTPGASNNEFIAPFMTDLIFVPGQGRCYYNFSPNNDTLVVTWDSVPFWDNAAGYIGANTFQVVLNYNDSSILCQYKLQQGASAATTGFLSAGIENTSGTIGLQYMFDVYPTPGSAVKYYHPATTTLAISDASTVYNDNPENGAIFLSKNGAPYYLTTEVTNSGNQNLAAFNVKSEVRSATNILQVTNTTSAGPLTPGQSQMITQATPFTPTVAGAFFFRTDTQLPGDATPSNNRRDVELEVSDTTLATIELAYENATAATAPNSWSGGDGGSAVYIKPSFAPYIIQGVKEFIAQNTNNVGYIMMVFDDNGPNGAPGTVLDSIFVAPGSFTLNAWTTTTLTNPVLKASGGFYVLWYMGGDGIGIGTVGTTPISNRTYEVLTGPTASNFAAYRDRETSEFMIRATISNVVSVPEISKDELFGNVYPNPASTDKVFMSYDLSASKTTEFSVLVYNAKGQVVQSKMVSTTKGTLELDIQNLQSGIYLCKIANGDTNVERRFTVVK